MWQLILHHEYCCDGFKTKMCNEDFFPFSEEEKQVDIMPDGTVTITEKLLWLLS
jgi:hypothetical protein